MEMVILGKRMWMSCYLPDDMVLIADSAESLQMNLDEILTNKNDGK